MIYLDNSATGGKKPDSVLTAVSSAVRLCANAGRGGHKLALSTAKLVQDCRKALNEFFDGYGFDRVVFTKNCTEALNVALFGLLEKGDHVVTTKMEHNSVLRPLEFLQKSGVITYSLCESVDAEKLPYEIEGLIQKNTKLVAVTTASNVNGAIPPIQKIRKAIPKTALLLCDGAQGAGHYPISMQRLGIDILTLAGHKGLMAIQGSGALLFSERANIKPYMHGGTGSMSFSLDMPNFYPDALEAGTLSVPAVSSLLEGVHELTLRQTEISDYILSLTTDCIARLQSLKNYTVYSKANPCGIVAFKHTCLPSEYIADLLSNDYDIAVRGGFHCAPLMHEALGTEEDGLVRASFSHFNYLSYTIELIDALQKIDALYN